MREPPTKTSLSMMIPIICLVLNQKENFMRIELAQACY